MHRILCSTGALIGRPNGRDFRLLYGAADRLRCDGFEFMMYESWYEKLIRREHPETCVNLQSSVA